MLKESWLDKKLQLLKFMTQPEIMAYLVRNNLKTPKKPQTIFEIPYHSVMPTTQGIDREGREITGNPNVMRMEKEKEIERLK
jgi:hypothetical protein